MAKKLTTVEFIERAKKIHGDKYDYSLVDYNYNNNKIKIICNLHGIFEQTPNVHIKGCGCKKCGCLTYREKSKSNTKKTIDEFILESEKIHGKKYNYSNTIYYSRNKKLEIECYLHGKFEQLPNNHLKGQGCPTCGKFLIGERLSLSNDDFIERSKNIHNNKYDYSLVEYKNATTRVKIICNSENHGIFEQYPQHHYRGAGCPKCAKKHNFSTTEIIEEFKIVHGDRYDYHKTKYLNIKTDIIITCKTHGDFKQSPSHHKNGVGCPKCANQNGGKFGERDLYILYDETYNIIKIGVSSNPEKRMKSIGGVNLILLRVFKNCGGIENILHKKYAQFRTEHKIYKDGKTEWFKLDKNEIINIEKFIRYHKLSSF